MPPPSVKVNVISAPSSASVISTVKHSKLPYVWLLTGPAEWMMHPCLLSAATLILRFCAANGPIKFEDGASLEKAFKKLLKKGNAVDGYIMENVYRKLPTIVKEYKKIFDRGSLVKNYTITELDDDLAVDGHCGGGIMSLCYSESIDKEANKIIRKLFQEED